MYINHNSGSIENTDDKNMSIIGLSTRSLNLLEIININFLSMSPSKSLRRQYMEILFANEREKVISKTEKLKYPISYPKNI